MREMGLKRARKIVRAGSSNLNSTLSECGVGVTAWGSAHHREPTNTSEAGWQRAIGLSVENGARRSCIAPVPRFFFTAQELHSQQLSDELNDEIELYSPIGSKCTIQAAFDPGEG